MRDEASPEETEGMDGSGSLFTSERTPGAGCAPMEEHGVDADGPLDGPADGWVFTGV